MIELILTGLGAGAVGFLAAKKLDALKYDIYVEQSKAKAKAIEHEAQLLLESSKTKIREAELAASRRYDEELARLKAEYDAKVRQLEQKEEALNARLEQELKNISFEKSEVKKIREEMERIRSEENELKAHYAAKLDEIKGKLERVAGMTREEAKRELLERVEENARAEIAHIVRRYETEAKNEARRRANYIIAQATTRYAAEFASERLINVVTLASDDIKGRIIGKEGRNIKTLETLLGVDIIIDDTPNAIVLSSFNLYRRAIATKTLEILIEDGRIQPARIEEVFNKVSEEFEEQILLEGEQIVMDLGIGYLHPELVKLVGKLKFRASYGQNALSHTLEVAHLAGIMAAELGGDEILAKRAGLLHDIGKALTHDYNGNHVDLGADICRRYKEDPVVINAIYAHHGHEEPKTIEAAAVCTADVLSAARPGARREVLESFLKRVEQIEEIATKKIGVKNAYAISAGREIRVIVNAQLVNDDESVLLSREIAKEIQEKVQYPGEIKVTVLREFRAVDYAR
ncbi:MAG: ribonuclease Y [Campylobacterales bacterium]